MNPKPAAALTALALVSLATGAAGSGAATPAGNGRIAYNVQPSTALATVYTVAPDGSGRQRVGEGSDPAWSPDGTRLAWVNRGVILVARPDGTEARPLAEGAMPAWSPDGTRIVFARRAGQSFSDWDLFVADVATGAAVALTGGPETDGRPAWSPDGGRIVFVRNQEIWVVGADGSGARRLIAHDAPLETPRFSPNGTRLAVGSRGAVYTVAADGSGALTRISPPGLWTVSPEWSPDGTRIAFVADGAVCTARTDGSDSRRVTFDNEGMTTYGPPTPISWQRTEAATLPDSPYRCADPRPDLAVSIEADRRRARVGDVVTFRAAARNNGPDPAWQTSFGLVLPEEAQFMAVSSVGDCHFEPNDTHPNFVACSPGLLFPGETETVTASVRLLAPGPARATAAASVHGSPQDPNGENNVARVAVLVVGCTRTGTTGADVLRGTPRADVLCGGPGDDTIRGLGGNDVIWGGPGADAVDGGDGRDRLLGGPGADHLDGSAGSDVAWGSLGKDLVFGGPGDDALHGGDAAVRRPSGPPYWDEFDRLAGGAGADLVDGGVGNDQLFGGPGGDLVLARDGSPDVAACDAGRDRLVADARDRHRGCERVARS